jgi:uncharacterized protein (DUF427 family)
MNKPTRIPGAGHAITIEPSPYAVVATVAGKVIACSARALVLREPSYPPVFYIPRQDIDMTLLQRSDHTTYSPHKGDCAYYSIPAGGERSVNAAWIYEAPFAAVAAIKDHLAFYPDRIDSIVEWFADYPSPLPGHDLALGPVQHPG